MASTKALKPEFSCKFVSNTNKMARKKLSQTQIACIILLWVALVVYILSMEISVQTLIAVIFSGAFIFIPIYKNIKK